MTKKNFFKIIYDEKLVLILGIIISSINFYVLLTNKIVMIDEEFFVTNDANPYNFLNYGRWTDFLYARVFFNGKIIDFFTDFIAIVLFNISALFFLYPYFEKSDNNIIKLLAVAMYVTLPFSVAQNFAFSQQIVPVAMSMCFTGVAFLITIDEEKNILKCFLAIFLLTIAIGSYQAFIEVYIVAMCSYLLYGALHKVKNSNVMKKGFIILILSTVFYCVVDHSLKNYYYNGEGNYLINSYVGLFSDEKIKNFLMAVLNVIRVNLGITIYNEVIYGGIVIRCIYLLFLFFMVIYIKKNKRKELILYYILFFISPYIIYILLFTYKTQGRMMLSLSIAISFQILVLYEFIKKEKYKKLFIFICMLFLSYNIVLNNMSFKIARDNYKKDTQYVNEIIKYIVFNNTDIRNKKLVTIGSIDDEKESKFKNVTIGASFFSWDGGNISRIRQLLKINDVDFLMPSREEIAFAYELSKNEPTWQEKKNIWVVNDLLIIKFSEPNEKWFKTNLGIEK